MIEQSSFLLTFTKGRTRDDYEHDMPFRLAVERSFMIIGEALFQLNRDHPEVAAQVPESRKIIGFRHILVHGYAQLNNDKIWEVIQVKVGPLLDVLKLLWAKISCD